MKTIIQTWSLQFKNLKSTKHDGRFGLGDIIRGTIALYQICKKYNYNYVVDIQLHPISNFLEVEKNKYSDLILENKDNINFIYPNNIENFITNNDDNIIMLFSNVHLIHDITDDCKSFIKNILKPNLEFKKYIDLTINKLSFKLDSVLHYRIAGINGDQKQFFKRINYIEYLNHVMKHKKENDILITDNLGFKEHIRQKNIDVFMFDIKIAHLGYDTNLDGIKDTLLEFFIMTKSEKIKYHPTNGPSGFIKIINYIWDIPLIKLV